MSEEINPAEFSSRLLLGWCKCAGDGFWFEQIDGPDNLRKVMCPKHPTFTMDLTKIEERLVALHMVPKRHPARFALLYGMGARKLSDLADTYLDFDVASRRVKLEAEIQAFENWQDFETAARWHRRSRENAAIAYAAVDAGIISPETGMKAVMAVGAKFPPETAPEVTTPPTTGRRWSEPDTWCVPMKVEGTISGRWSPIDDHPYPEEGILRD